MKPCCFQVIDGTNRIICHNKPYRKSTKLDHQNIINHKIQNLKALDRAIFNMNMRVNGVFDKDYNHIQHQENFYNINDSTSHSNPFEQLVKLKTLKNNWEKDLLDMYSIKNE